ncbi:MAG: adenylate kinase family protein [Candidatus Njordarchaeia archaeon]
MVVIAICGTPGTGKTTIATYLEKYGFEVINLSKFVIKNKLYIGYDAQRDSYIIDPKKVVQALKEVISRKKGEGLVIEGIGAEAIPENLVDICVVLTCDIPVLEQRLKEKGYNNKKIEENLEAERFSEILIDALENFKGKVITFNTAKDNPENIVKKILEKIKELR